MSWCLGGSEGQARIALCKVLVSLTPAPGLGQDMATWILQQRLLGFLLWELYYHSLAPSLRRTQTPDRQPWTPILYLVRECLPMRTRSSASVKFLSQGGYRRQWAAVRTQRSLMRLAPHSSSWGFFRKIITCLRGGTGSIIAEELPLHQP